MVHVFVARTRCLRDGWSRARPPRCKASRHLAAACFGSLAVLATPAAAAGPSVASINLCTDQLLIGLADREQIKGLSPYARDAARSWFAVEAAAFPILSGTAEEVLVLKPDLVLAGRYTKRATRELLKRQGLRVVEFEAASSIDGIKDQIRRAGALLGHPDRAQAMLATIEAAIERARAAVSRRPLSVLPLQRRGWISGRDTLVTSILTLLGLRNAGAVLDGNGRQVTLETIVSLRPDLLLVTTEGGRADDQGSALLEHPALARLYPASGRLVLPEALTVCGGPMLVQALDRLAADLGARR